MCCAVLSAAVLRATRSCVIACLCARDRVVCARGRCAAVCCVVQCIVMHALCCLACTWHVHHVCVHTACVCEYESMHNYACMLPVRATRARGRLSAEPTGGCRACRRGGGVCGLTCPPTKLKVPKVPRSPSVQRPRIQGLPSWDAGDTGCRSKWRRHWPPLRQ